MTGAALPAQDYVDIQNLYVTPQGGGAKVPLRQVSELAYSASPRRSAVAITPDLSEGTARITITDG